MNFDEALKATRDELCVQYEHRAEQIEAMRLVCCGFNVFCMLPTGFGKSDIYALTPLIMSKMMNQRACALIVSPLRALINDQVRRWRHIGCEALRECSEHNDTAFQGVVDGKCQLLFTTPETLVKNKAIIAKWQKLIKVLVFDEVHCVEQWGDTFRPLYKEVSSVRAFLNGIPVLALSATLTSQMMENIRSMLCMTKENTKVVSTVQDRPNIYLSIAKTSGATKKPEVALDWYIRLLVEHGTKAPKCIVYCRSFATLGTVYLALARQTPTRSDRQHYGLVCQYHSQLSATSTTEIPAEFTKADSDIRCLVATVAFGLGVQIHDVDYVIHWGPPSTIIEYWQEIGRAGRSGESAKAIMHVTPGSMKNCSDQMKDLIDHVNSCCIRYSVLSSFQVGDVSHSDIIQCCHHAKCCSFCSSVFK